MSTVLGITLNALLEGGKINVEVLAAQALGAMAAQEVGMRLQNTLEAQKQKLSSYAKGQKAGQGVGGASSSNGRGVGSKTSPSQTSRSKSQYKAEPSKKDWASMEFEGWEKASVQQFYDQVESDLKPPEIHWAENPRPPTDEEQVAAYARSRAAMQSSSSSASYSEMAKTFGISLAKSVAAPLIFAEEVLGDPNKAVFYSQMARNAVRHPINTAIAIDRALGQGIVQGVDTFINGDNISRAALAGSLVGGVGMPFFAKALGIGVAGAGIIKVEAEVVNTVDSISPYDLNITHSRTMSNRAFNKFINNEIKPNGIQDTIKYVNIEGEKYVVDGHHRLEAAKILRFEVVPVQEVQLPYLGYKTIEDLLYSGSPY